MNPLLTASELFGNDELYHFVKIEILSNLCKT
jgi:hypothetical protein